MKGRVMSRRSAVILSLSALVGLAGARAGQWPLRFATGSASAADVPADPADDAFVGAFGDRGLRVVVERVGRGYHGAITKGPTSYPLTARRPAAAGHAARMDGAFTANGRAFAFEAHVEGNELVLTTDGTTHRLPRLARR